MSFFTVEATTPNNSMSENDTSNQECSVASSRIMKRRVS